MPQVHQRPSERWTQAATYDRARPLAAYFARTHGAPPGGSTLSTSAKPSQGERRRAREHARQHGVRYADALRAIRADVTTEASSTYLYVQFPYPRLADSDPGCIECGGSGVNGTLYTAAEHDGQVLLCDQICDECEGCGSAWCACGPLWLDDGRDWDREEDDDAHAEAGFDICPSCRDRGFYLVQTFVKDDPEADPRPLRFPCGCMEGFTFDITDDLVRYEREA